MKKLRGISIIVATFNRPKDTLELLESIEKSFQYFYDKLKEYPKIEVIIADNSTNNETREIPYRKFSYVRYIKIKPLGVSFVRDYAISRSKHEYIMITDSDCIVKEDWLLSIHQSLKKYNYPDVIQGAYFFPYKDNWLSNSESGWDKIRYFKQKQADTRNFLIKRKFYRAIGGFNKKHFYSTGAEDLFLLKKLKKINAKIIFDENIIVFHKYPSLRGELKRYFFYGKAAIHIKYDELDLFNKEFSPLALWKNLFTFRFGQIGPIEYSYQSLKLLFFTIGYFIGKNHYKKELKENKIISPYLNYSVL